MNLKQIIAILWARRWITILTALLLVGSSTIFSLMLPKRFEASSIVRLELFKPDPVSGAIINSKSLPAYISTLGALVRDNRTTGRAVDSLGWASLPDYQQAFQRQSQGRSGDLRQWLGDVVANSTRVSMVDETNLMRITYVANDPNQAALIADTVRQAFIDQDLATKRLESEKSASWFSEQAKSVNAEILRQEALLVAFQRTNDLPILTTDGSDSDSVRLSYLNRRIDSGVAIDNSTESAIDSGQLASINAQIANAEKVLGPNNPDLAALRNMRTVLLKSQQSRRAPAPLQASKLDVDQEVSALKRKVLDQRNAISESKTMLTNIAGLRSQYENLLSKAQDARRGVDIQSSTMIASGAAAVPIEPVFPNYLFMIPAAALLGLILGIEISLLAELMGRRVRSEMDLETAGIPLLSALRNGRHSPKRHNQKSFFKRIQFKAL